MTADDQVKLLSIIYHRCLCPVPSKCVRKRPEVSVFYAVGFIFRFSLFHGILIFNEPTKSRGVMTMGPILTKAQMTEEDIKLQFITPAITARWPREHITMEQKITDGKINLKGNLVVREKPKKADYVLYLQANLPIAIVEAKDNNHSVSYGLQQAITALHLRVGRLFFSGKTAGFVIE